MLDYDPDYYAPESTTALVVGTAFLASWTLAVALYWPDEQARADRKYATQTSAEHTQVCVNLGFELRSVAFANCISELVRLQLRHQEIHADRLAASSLH